MDNYTHKTTSELIDNVRNIPDAYVYMYPNEVVLDGTYTREQIIEIAELMKRTFKKGLINGRSR